MISIHKPREAATNYFLIGYNDLIGVDFCWTDSSSSQADCAGDRFLLICQR